MPVTTEHREQYRQWLLDRELQPDVAAAILESMPPFDWSEIARRSDLAEVEGRLDNRLDGVDKRLDGVDKRLDGVDKRLDGVDKRLDKVENRLDGIDGRLDGVDGRLDLLTDRVDKVADGLIHMTQRIDSLGDSLNGRIDSLSQALTAHGSQMVVTMLLGFTAIITATIVSLLTLA